MTSIDGHNREMLHTIGRSRRATSRPIWWDTRTSTTTDPGLPILPTAASGIPIQSRQDGLRIAMDTGHGSRPGVGLGWTTSLGVMRRSITDAGPICVIGGDGSPAQCKPSRFMLPHWWRLSEEQDLESRSLREEVAMDRVAAT